MASMVKIEWGEKSNRFYADSVADIESIIADTLEPERITGIVWPDGDEGIVNCKCGASYWKGEVLTVCPKCGEV